jgi:hypothetical protein
MEGADPTIRYHNFMEKGRRTQETLFICENIWEAKQITDEDTKVAQLEITFRNHALDWFMSLVVNNPQG